MPQCSLMSMGTPLFISKLKFSYDKYSVGKVWTKIYCQFYFRGITLKNLAPLFHPIKSKAKTNRDSPTRVFPRTPRVLIGSLYCLCALWLAKVITLVLALRHSLGNRSFMRREYCWPLKMIFYFCTKYEKWKSMHDSTFSDPQTP